MNALISQVPKWLWIVIALVVAVLLTGLISSKFTGLWETLKKLVRQDGGDYTDGPPGTERENEIDQMCAEAYAQMNTGVTNPFAREKALEALMELNDSELKYAAKRYKYYSPHETLYAAVNAEIMPFANVKHQLMARLANIKKD